MGKGYVGIKQFEDANLPSGYTQLAYIQSSGTQYIDTDFKPNQDTRVVMLVEFAPSTSNNFLFGALTTNVGRFAFANYSNGSYRVHYYSGYTEVTSSTKYTNKFKLDMNKNVTTFNDGEYACNATYNSFQCEHSLWLFDFNNVGKSGGASTAKLYSCQIYDNGTLVRDFVPCNNSSGTIGLYDLVNSKFYTNAGTGTFVAGSSVQETAREIKKAYIGIETEVPIYEEQKKTITVSTDNINDVFEVTNAQYYFAGSGSTFTTNNKGKASSTALTTLTAKIDMSVSFTYSYSSEYNYDKLTIIAAEKTVADALSGVTEVRTYSGSLKVGQTIEFKYVKDSSKDENDDQCKFYNMSVTGNIKTQVGTETKAIARKITKGYLGVNAVARNVFDTVEPEADTLEGCSWENISAVAKSGNAPEYWNIGDRKTYTESGATYEVEIIGFNHDPVTNPTEYGRAKAGITFQFVGTIGGSGSMHDSDTNVVGWANCKMRKSTSSTIAMPYVLNKYMSTELQNIIVPVDKYTGSGGSSPTLEVVSDKVFLLSEVEVFGTTTQTVTGEGEQYQYYALGNSPIKNNGVQDKSHWLRSPSTETSRHYCYVLASGSLGRLNSMNDNPYMCPAFCV